MSDTGVRQSSHQTMLPPTGTILPAAAFVENPLLMVSSKDYWCTACSKRSDGARLRGHLQCHPRDGEEAERSREPDGHLSHPPLNSRRHCPRTAQPTASDRLSCATSGSLRFVHPDVLRRPMGNHPFCGFLARDSPTKVSTASLCGWN